MNIHSAGSFNDVFPNNTQNGSGNGNGSGSWKPNSLRFKRRCRFVDLTHKEMEKNLLKQQVY